MTDRKKSAEVNPASNETKRHAKRDEAKLRIEPHQRLEIVKSRVPGDRRRKIREQPEHQDERNHGLEPLLQQQLGQQQSRRVARAQPLREADHVRGGHRH
jgi:hypothetical protein